MTPTELLALAKRLKVEIGSTTPSADSIRQLRKALDSRLLVLQSRTSGWSKVEYQLLMKAREELPSGDIVRASAHRELVAAGEDHAEHEMERWIEPSERAEQREATLELSRISSESVSSMHRTYSAVSTKATSDFRKSRIVPLGTVGTLAAALWGTQAALGIRFPSFSWQEWSYVCAGVLAVSLAGLLVAGINQRRAETWLRCLYETDVQAEILFQTEDRTWHGIYWNERSKSAVDDFKPELEESFTAPDYAGALRREAWWKANKQYSRSLPSPFWGHLARRLVRQWSTIDIASAAADATEQALDRFVRLGVLESFLERAEIRYRVSKSY